MVLKFRNMRYVIICLFMNNFWLHLHLLITVNSTHPSGEKSKLKTAPRCFSILSHSRGFQVLTARIDPNKCFEISLARNLQPISLLADQLCNDLNILIKTNLILIIFISFHCEHFSAPVNIHRKCANVLIIFKCGSGGLVSSDEAVHAPSQFTRITRIHSWRYISCATVYLTPGTTMFDRKSTRIESSPNNQERLLLVRDFKETKLNRRIRNNGEN